MGFFSDLLKPPKKERKPYSPDPKKDKIVWRKGSQVYHLFSCCIDSSDPDMVQTMTEFQAKRKGLRCCKKCEADRYDYYGEP